MSGNNEVQKRIPLESDSNTAANANTYARASANGNAESWTGSKPRTIGIRPDLQIFDGKDGIGVLDIVEPLCLNSRHFTDNGYTRPLN